MCNQKLPVRSGLGTLPNVDVSAERAGRARHSEVAWRDQYEDRKLPPYFVVPVQNPSGVEPGLYFAVYNRATMARSSVWFENPNTAQEHADTWVEQYGDTAGEPVWHGSVNVIWEQRA